MSFEIGGGTISSGGLSVQQVNRLIANSRNAKGTHVATLAIPPGSYQQRQGLGPWVLQSGIPNGFRIVEEPASGRRRAVTGGRLIVPSVQVTNDHAGWLYELLNGSTILRQGIMPLGDNDPGPDLRNTIMANLYQRSNAATSDRYIILLNNQNFTIPEGSSFALRIYIALN